MYRKKQPFKKTKKALKKNLSSKKFSKKLPTDQKILRSLKELFIFIKRKIFNFKKKLFLKKHFKVSKYLSLRTSFKKPKKVYIFAFVIFIFSIFFYLYFLKDLPSARTLTTREIPLSTKIYDRNGKILYSIYAEENRTWIFLHQVPLHLRQATIAIEDKDFYKHGGFALRGMIRALSEIILHKNLQGGSTITQQLIKSALLSPERTLQRKVKELILSFWTESIYSKDEILEMYLNQVPYGGTAWGIEAAAETYFGKSVSQLSLSESALLAGLPAAPTYYSPFGAHPNLAKKRQEEVLRRMREDGYITKEQEEKAKKEKLNFKKPLTSIKAPHYVMFVKDQLVKKYGEKMVEKGGLKVITTLDLKLQEYAESVISSELERMKKLKVGNACALVTKPGTGEILVMVGSRDYFDTENDGNVNVTISPRSPGSSIKPLNYALGFAKKIITPATLFLDVPICFPDSGGKKYCPGNYDGRFHGPVQVRFALGNSYNIPAVKVLKLNGLEDFIATASSMGITTFSDPSRYGLSLTLGGGEVKMVDMAVAFGVFANGGIKKDLVSILKIMDKKGKILEEFDESKNKKEAKRIFTEEVAYLISHILLDDNARAWAFGSGSLLNIKGHPEVAVKTGTAEDKRDNWTIGYNTNYLTAAWVGNNDNSPMSPYLESGGSGAAPIWNKIMSRVLLNTPSVWPKKPANIVGAEICFDGKLPEGDNCPGKRFEYFIKGTVPLEKTQNYTQKIFIDKNTNKPAVWGQTENIEEREVEVMSDLVQKNVCVSCPY